MKKELTTGMFAALLILIVSATPSNADNHIVQDLIPPENSHKTSDLDTVYTVAASCLITEIKTNTIEKTAYPKEVNQDKNSQNISKLTVSLPERTRINRWKDLQLEIAKKAYVQDKIQYRAQKFINTNNPPILAEPTAIQFYDRMSEESSYQHYGNGGAALVFLGSIVWIIGLIKFFSPTKNEHPYP